MSQALLHTTKLDVPKDKEAGKMIAIDLMDDDDVFAIVILQKSSVDVGLLPAVTTFFKRGRSY